MSEYIEREVLYKKLLEMEALARARVIDTPTTSPEYQRYRTQLTERVQVARMVEDAPAADVAPVVHGGWEVSDTPCECFKCSECGGGCWYYDYQGDVAKSRYCPNCGAKMDKEATDGD